MNQSVSARVLCHLLGLYENAMMTPIEEPENNQRSNIQVASSMAKRCIEPIRQSWGLDRRKGTLRERHDDSRLSIPKNPVTALPITRQQNGEEM